MSQIHSAEDFFNIFKSTLGSEYENFTQLTDTEIGFSIQREYPKAARYTPPVRKSGTADTVAIIHVAYDPEARHRKKQVEERVPVQVTITTYSKWMAHHYAYDFTDENCPTKESIAISNKTPKPHGLYEEVYYDNKNNVFTFGTEEKLSPNELLNLVFERHLKTTGYLFVAIHTSKNKVRDLCSMGVDLIRYYFLEETWHWNIEDTIDNIKCTQYGYPESAVRKRPLKELDLFGYTTSTSTIILFCCLVLTFFSIYHLLDINEPVLRRIKQSNFLTVIIGLISLYVLDNIVPKVLLKTMNALIWVRTNWL